MGWGRLGVAALGVLAGACSLLTSLDGYTGGAATPAGADASVEPRDGGAPEASASDAAPSDAGPPFCEGKTGFCADFDEGAALPGGWDGMESTSGTVVVDNGNLVVTTTAGSASVCLQKKVAPGVSSIDVDFDVKVEGLGSFDFDFVALYGSADHNLSLQINAAKGSKLQFDEDIPLVDGGPDEINTDTTFVFDGAWHHVHWTNAIGVPTTDVAVTVDGNAVGTLKADTRDYASPTVLSVGDCVANKGWRVRYDNVQMIVK